MSYESPNIATYTLKGIDSRIQTIQRAMASLSWLEYSFGLAERIVELKDEKEYVYPAAYESGSLDPLSMMPTDAWDSFSFWTKSEESKFEKTENTQPMLSLMKYNVSCIFYMDFNDIATGRSYKEVKAEVIEEIFDFFSNVKLSGQLIPLRFVEDDITKVYEGFTIEQVDNLVKMYPKWACRMDFELNFWGECI